MKLQFDPDQPLQLDAVAAVTERFDGQSQGARDLLSLARRFSCPIISAGQCLAKLENG